MPYNEAAGSLFDAIPTTLNFNDPKAYTKGKKVIHVGTARDKLMKHEVHETIVTDLRSCEGTHFTLDRNGFQHMNEATSLNHDDFSDSEIVKKHYWPEVMEILKKATGASHAVYESHLIRSSRWEDVQEEARQLMQGESGGGMCQKMDPLRATHVDQSYLGAEQTLRLRFGDEKAERLMEKRWALINVWRPLRAIRRDNLALCDWRSLSEIKDLAAVDLVLPTPSQQKSFGRPYMANKQNVIERWDINYNPEQKWYYLSNMQPDECLLIKVFDSEKDGIARCCPHSAFEADHDEGPARESIEVRTMLFWDDEQDSKLGLPASRQENNLLESNIA